MEESHEIQYVTKTYRYDPVDRLISAADRTGSEVFGYDRSGNLVSRGTSLAPQGQVPAAPAKAPGGHVCPQCGATVQPGKKFCPQCGEKIG